MTTRALLAIALLAAACGASSDGDEPFERLEQGATPIDRMLIGEAAQYPADAALRGRLADIDANEKLRRDVAWKTVQKVVAPVAIAGKPYAKLPRFQTWYTSDDFLPMFDRLFGALTDSEKRAHAPFSERAISEVFPWNATRAPSLASFTEERLEARKRELATDRGLRSLGKDARTLMSPAYVAHLFRSYGEVLACDPEAKSTEFAPCLAGEFPIDAVAVKARWIRGDEPMPVYDSSSLAKDTFDPAGDRTADPDDARIYTMQLSEDTSMRLAALHVATKELRDWLWITLFWSDTPDPDSPLTGVWKNYRMCVVTSFDQPGRCSNPYLELGAGNGNTNCIGCHQHGGTAETTQTILAKPTDSKKKVRSTFPTDYAFTTSAGLDLAAQMRARAFAMTPAPAESQ
jgi:hypothetical protein